MDSKQLFLNCIEKADEVIGKLKVSDFNKPTPDEGWNVNRLLVHMFYELYWISDIISGISIEEVGYSYDNIFVDHSFKKKWDIGCDRAKKVIEEAEFSQNEYLSFVVVTNEDYINQISGEMLIHAWDLAKAINYPLVLGEQLAQKIYQLVKPKVDSMQLSGMFKRINVSENADITTKVLALYGRSN